MAFSYSRAALVPDRALDSKLTATFVRAVNLRGTAKADRSYQLQVLHQAILHAGCDAWNMLVASPETIMSIGLSEWAHAGQ